MKSIKDKTSNVIDEGQKNLEQNTSKWTEAVKELIDKFTGKDMAVKYEFHNLEIDMPRASGPDGKEIGSAKWKINGRFVISTELHDKSETLEQARLQGISLDIKEDNPSINTLVKTLKIPKGKINIQMDDKPVLSLVFDKDKVLFDVKDANIFGVSEGDDHDISIFEEINTAKKLAQILDDNNFTISILRKGKKAISLGKEASPTLSRLLTGSDDIQIDSIRQATKLGREVQKANDE